MSLNDYTIHPDKGPAWPTDENGARVAPAFLEHVAGKLETEMAVSLLRAFGIPTVCEYPNNGDFAKVIMGYAPAGTDIYVPETLLDDAKNIISSDMSGEVE